MGALHPAQGGRNGPFAAHGQAGRGSGTGTRSFNLPRGNGTGTRTEAMGPAGPGTSRNGPGAAVGRLSRGRAGPCFRRSTRGAAHSVRDMVPLSACGAGDDAILLLLTREPCARSSASCVLECSGGESPKIQGVLTAASRIAEVARQRTGPAFGRKAPGRATSWDAAPAWMQAAGR